jgi:hypothetical protein
MTFGLSDFGFSTLEALGLSGEREAMLDVSSRAGVEALGLGARGAMTWMGGAKTRATRKVELRKKILEETGIRYKEEG